MYAMRGLFDSDRYDLDVLDMLILQESLKQKAEKEVEDKFPECERHYKDYEVTENEWYGYEEE